MKPSVPYIFPATLLALAACRSDKDRMGEIVEEWQGKEIILPDDMTDFLTGDTIDLSDADFTILTYVDSTGCTGCKMKLSLWKRYLNSLDTLGYSSVDFLMIVNTVDGDELKNTLSMYAFTHPLYMDQGNKIDSVNGFPDEMRFQTFLLNDRKQIMAIGSPVGSTDIEKMYNSIISGKISMSPVSESAVSISENTLNFGRIGILERSSRTVTFTNLGKDTIRIGRVESSCECTDITFPHDIIPPSSEVEATVHFRGDTIPGEFERTIHVYYPDMDYPTVINITGNIYQ